MIDVALLRSWASEPHLAGSCPPLDQAEMVQLLDAYEATCDRLLVIRSGDIPAYPAPGFVEMAVPLDGPIVLSPTDFDRVSETIEHPEPPTPALRELLIDDYRRGISDALAVVRSRQAVLPDLQHPAYRVALEEVETMLRGLLERGPGTQEVGVARPASLLVLLLDRRGRPH